MYHPAGNFGLVIYSREKLFIQLRKMCPFREITPVLRIVLIGGEEWFKEKKLMVFSKKLACMKPFE